MPFSFGYFSSPRGIKAHIINPKALSRKSLLGHLDLDTREWFDGVLTHAAREVPAGTLYIYARASLSSHFPISRSRYALLYTCALFLVSYTRTQVAKEPASQRCWIICDGDIDPEWIESLNSVLDDNRLLTLPSGERIEFGQNVNFIFECHTLRYASPATGESL